MSHPKRMVHKRETTRLQIRILQVSLLTTRYCMNDKKTSCRLQLCSPINIYFKSQFGQIALKPAREIATRDYIEMFLFLIWNLKSRSLIRNVVVLYNLHYTQLYCSRVKWTCPESLLLTVMKENIKGISCI